VSGIVGAVHFDGSRSDPYLLLRMLTQISHRGPDASGMYTERGIGLAHTRLSIVDSRGGQQPMHNEDRSLWVTLDGEIFNHLELRDALASKGHRFITRSDTEVILHAYEQYGEECVQHFNGQWAFAVWDRNERRLFASRDRLAVRPLFYTIADGKLLFASEIKSLFAHPDVDRRIDPRGLNQLFTFQTTLAPRTVFEAVHELPPGHNLIVHDGEITLRRYWQPDYDLPAEPIAASDCAGQLLDLLVDATRLRLRCDVPVGAHLSGGLDSAVTAALARQCTDSPLRTFSIAFDDAEFDESHYQSQAAEALGLEHQTLRCCRDDVARLFPDMIWHAERPVLQTDAVPMYLLSKLVREAGCKVVLTGDGADELLGGHDLFKQSKVRRFWVAQPDSAFRAGLLEKLYPDLFDTQARPPACRKAWLRVRPDDLASPFFSHLLQWELTSQLKAFFSGDLRSVLPDGEAYADCRELLPSRYAAWHHFCQAQYLETVTMLPGHVLSSRGDRVGMAHSVEQRSPFLDYRVVEFAARTRPRLKMNGLNEKYLLKRAARELVPREILERRKRPVRAPGAECFMPGGGESVRQDYVDELLSPRRIEEDGVFDPDAVARLVRRVQSGHASHARDSMALVGILSTQVVMDRFVREFDARCAGAGLCQAGSSDAVDAEQVGLVAPAAGSGA